MSIRTEVRDDCQESVEPELEFIQRNVQRLLGNNFHQASLQKEARHLEYTLTGMISE